MRKTKITVALLSMIAGTLLMIHLSPDADANASGAPAGTTGSPSDGYTCRTSGCHTGTALATQAGLITSTIPNTGYIPGQTYTITASISTSGRIRYGFEISPQNTSGTKEGTLIITNSTATKLLSSGKYITHKSGGTSFTSGTATWSFNWTAPAAGTGSVTFYGAFNSANNNGSESGDIITVSTLTVSEAVSTEVANVVAYSNNVNIYPNPFTENLTIKNNAATNNTMQVSIMDINGRVVKQLTDVENNQTLLLNELAKGYYVCRIETTEGVAIKKLIKN